MGISTCGRSVVSTRAENVRIESFYTCVYCTYIHTHAHTHDHIV